MKRWIGCALLAAGLALVPAACGDDAAGSSSHGSSTPAAHEEHAADGPTSTAPTTTVPSRLDVVATEYGWTGVPDELPAGSYPLSFRNDGTEAHEISIFRNPDHRSLEELYELGPVGIKDAVESVETVIAAPGTTAEETPTITLTPGEYEVVCFIPAATDSRPHFEHGMHRTLVVR